MIKVKAKKQNAASAHYMQRKGYTNVPVWVDKQTNAKLNNLVTAAKNKGFRISKHSILLSIVQDGIDKVEVITNDTKD